MQEYITFRVVLEKKLWKLQGCHWKPPSFWLPGHRGKDRLNKQGDIGKAGLGWTRLKVGRRRPSNLLSVSTSALIRQVASTYFVGYWFRLGWFLMTIWVSVQSIFFTMLVIFTIIFISLKKNIVVIKAWLTLSPIYQSEHPLPSPIFARPFLLL